ncbi:mismatch repair ATPase MSH6 [Suhomyces tanzawaensis NRRL Y-17324]|uniref:DNA mismatch repair protein n=1 Tax=Suhomyces tanzawaensis NRRL Y-17324 TaxID=984487 RepID=A0A1E4SEM2_9ASCO|nr:mismatch repair ATPase MSH6 [Suhomyces tanzawaensis NRRL Y-17324]ODV77979.1 mismatch repair ATPase MSH6 [Suhomyces tanzawaensis NRRL Y-17324]
MARSTKPATPSKAARASLGSSGTKKKQLSLMSFFKPATLSPSMTPKVPSSPLKTKSFSHDPSSDKENDNSILQDDTRLTDTPLTSESEATPKKSVDPKKPLSEFDDNRSHNSSSPSKRRNRSRSVSYAESDDEEITTRSSKRTKVLDSEDEDEEDEFVPPAEDDDEDDMSDFIVEDDKESEPEVEEDDEEEEVTRPKKEKKKAPKPSLPPRTKSGGSSSSSLGNKFKSGSSYQATGENAPSLAVKTAAAAPAKKNFAKENEERYQWLVNIKDSEKRPKDHPDYDPRTLYIPQSAWSKFTAFEKQYWEIKCQMWNTVVFFKKGKFYELYENDAMIANKEFDLKIAGGGRANMKLAGIPEMSFEYWAKEFISHGYKVAKVDQKETLLAKEMRGGSGVKEEKIIKRELTSILTGGTLTDLNMISDDMSIYCLSIKEETLDDGSKVFGVAFVDTSTGELNLIEFQDDPECTKLETLVTQVKPKEVICEKGNLSSIATKILKFNAQNQIWNSMNPISEFWDYDITLETLVKSKYYEAADLDDYSKFPPALKEAIESHKVCFNAFGGLLSYLKVLKLDESIMTLANMNQYSISKSKTSNLILDGITLNNLEILNNSFDGGDRGTLFKLINKAITPFGKRTLKHWVLHPLMQIKDINDRYDSIEYLMNDGLELRTILEQSFTGLPDLERLISRVHSKTLRFKDFLKVIEAFERISTLINQVEEFTNEESGVLFKYIKKFPSELKSIIGEWEDAFDRAQAKNDVIIPNKGIDETFDESYGKIQSYESTLNEHLKEYKRTFKSNEIVFRDSGKEIYLIEFPNKLEKKVPHDWQQMGSTSKVKRFWSPEVRTLVKELLEQKELHKTVCDTLKFRMYERFDKHYSVWMSTIKSISSIDCLLALTRTSETMGYPSCRPEFVDSEHGLVDFKELRHPCFVGTTKEFIPNDICLGGESNANFGLLTGANAAGKSTIMRTTALAIILSQLGCYIPASLAKLSPIDRIMTRLGANDNIMQGKSTFFVELSETKKILSNATTKSLVILDELGRGGSSSDGYAIAESVLYHLSTHVQPLGFFATHYGTLGDAFKNHPQIKPLRMGILIDNNSRNITFLYKLEEGAASGSFGMNVASMCGISEDIVSKAEVAATEYEQTSKLRRRADEDKVAKLSLGVQSDFAWFAGDKIKTLEHDVLDYNEMVKQRALETLFRMVD